MKRSAIAFPMAALLAADQMSGRSTPHIHNHDYSQAVLQMWSANNNNVLENVYWDRQPGNNNHA